MSDPAYLYQRYAESGAMVEAVARVLAKQMFHPGTDIHVMDAWEPQDDRVKRSLRLKAVEILKTVDVVRAIR